MSVLDLVVIGGGITGAGVARLAARHGLSVTLLEQRDLASGTSSATSHMLHGGLRYLEHGRLMLVRESLAERGAVSRMAPGLVKPTRFLVPLYRGGRVGPFRLRVGLTLYDWLAGSGGLAPHAWMRARAALELEPGIEPNGLLAAGVYSDVVMDDARLCVAVARDAAANGATIHTYTEVVGARPGDRGAIEVIARDQLDGGERSFVTRRIVNATGPWADTVRRLLRRALTPGGPEPEPVLRPSRGIHLVYPRLTRGRALLLLAHDGRVFFAIPFGEHTLVGTTEIEVPAVPPAAAFRPTLDEVRYLKREIGRVFPKLEGVEPLAVLSGIRPLARSESGVARASREHRAIEEGAVMTLVGGKYTAFRAMARDALHRLLPALGRANERVHDVETPLPRPLEPGARIDAIAEFAVGSEFARRVDDVLRRRTRLWLEADRGRKAAGEIAPIMARRLSWSPERLRDEVQHVEATLWEEESLLERARRES